MNAATVVLWVVLGVGNTTTHQQMDTKYETLDACERAGRLLVAREFNVRGYVCVGEEARAQYPFTQE